MSEWERAVCGCCGGLGTVIPAEGFRDLREQAGVSLSELAREAGVSVSYLSDLERGRRSGLGPRVQQVYGRLWDRVRVGGQK